MPDVKMPDGNIVRFPDEMPSEEIKALIASKFPELVPEKPIISEVAQPVSADVSAEDAQGVGLSPLLEQGATAFLSDEISGASRAVGQFGRNVIAGDPLTQGVSDAFDVGTDEARAKIAQSLEENPIAGRVVEGVGALATGPGRLLASAGSTLFGRIAAASAEGGLLGGLFGFGAAEGGVAERLPEAAESAAIGASVAGVLPLAVKGAELVSRPLRTAANALRPAANAEVKVVEALARDNITPAQATAQLNRAQKAGVPQAVADVAGANTQRLARSARTVPGAGSEKIDNFLIARQLNQPDRVLSAVRRTLGGDDVFKVADDIVAERSALANRMYGEAFETAKPVNTASIKTSIKKQLGTAVGKTQSSLKKLQKDIGKKKDIEALHSVKTELDDMISAAQRAGRSNQVRVLMDVKNGLLSSLKKSSPEYDKARQVFSSLSENVDALTAGQKFLNKDARLTAKELAKMTDGEKEFFRLGASEALGQKINSAPDGASIARRIFASPAQRAKLKAVFPNDRSFREFQATMLREARTTQTNQFVRGNSQTVDKAAELVDAQGGAVVQDLLRGDPVRAATRTAGAALNIAQGITPKTADAIADILTSTDPKVINTIMKALEARAATSAATSQGVNAGIGAATREGVALTN